MLGSIFKYKQNKIDRKNRYKELIIINIIIHMNFQLNNITEETIRECTDYVCDQITSAYDAIASLEPNNLSFRTIFLRLKQSDIFISEQCSIATNMYNFHVDAKVREASVEAEKKINNLKIESSLRGDVYYKIKLYETTTYLTECKTLTDEENRIMTHALRHYRRSGMLLGNSVVKDLQQKISTLESDFLRNINEDNTFLELTAEELDGMPVSWFTESKISNSEKKLYKLTMKFPDYIPAIEYCRHTETRKRIYTAFNTRVLHNIPIANEIIRLRQKLAHTLGYKSFADYKLEISMAKNSAHVKTFLSKLSDGFTPILKQNYRDITQFANDHKENPLNKTSMEKHDVNYYARLYKESKLSLNMEELKSYFATNNVVSGVFNIYQKLLGLTFTQKETDNVWHESVKLYRVSDIPADWCLGYFYIDLYPREGKFTGAAVFQFVKGCSTESHRQLPIAAIACNFPTTNLTFKDVKTFFHEFGHVMHHICSLTNYPDHTGFNVEQDFLEAPSQMLENWCYQAEPLKILSIHESTAQSLPMETVEKIKQIDNIDSGVFNKRQLLFGIFDMAVHSIEEEIPEDFSCDKVWSNLENSILLIDTPEYIKTIAVFGHIIGYAAGYYTYLMSETYACDMFATVFAGNELNPKCGMKYRKEILEKGSTIDGLNLLINFLGREPNNKAFLIKKGLSE